MKKRVLILLILFSFLEKNTAQEGIIAIARYDSTGPGKMRFDDPLLEFSGGFQAFQSLFLKEFKMPTKALRAEKAPDGMVGFTVNLVGKITNIEIIDSVSAELDAEVVRILTNISEFHPLPKPLQFAIQYNVFPDWFRDYIQEKEQDEQYRLQAVRADSLLKNTHISDLEKRVDNNKAYFSGDVWLGFMTMNDPLSKYLKPTAVLGFDLNFFKNDWFVGGNLQLRNTKLKKDFDYMEAFWAKDTSVSFVGFGLTGGYKVIDEDRLAFTPFVSIGFGSLALPSTENVASPNGSDIASFAPTIGCFVDYKYKVRARRFLFESKLNTTVIRLRMAVSPMNFKDGRHGNVVDVGIGIGFSQQSLKLD
jgi:hypothetical protein